MANAQLTIPDALNTDGAIQRLYDCSQPYLIGVRHHSAALAKCMVALLEKRSPDVILLELPPEFESWLPWLAHPETKAPVALAGCPEAMTSRLSFYPFADFSPELVAIRWAFCNSVPVELIDLPIADRHADDERTTDDSRGFLGPLLNRAECNDTGQLWDQQVESRAPHSTAEQIRRAGLLFGWTLRWNQKTVSNYDRRREDFMRTCIAKHEGRNAVAVIGSFHAAALLPEPVLWSKPDAPAKADDQSDSEAATQLATALIPYSFDQLDERSGYPAGVRDPMWHQAVRDSLTIEQQQHSVADFAVSICRHMRSEGHPMNAAHAQEVVRVAADLATVRGYRVAGRQELLEALQLCLSQGQVYGIGKSVASAMQAVLVGNRSGALPSDLPRCGLEPALQQLFLRYRLPGADSMGQQKRMRLDCLRSRLDRAREIIFQQLNVCQIPYATAQGLDESNTRENLTSVWTIEWTNATAATIALSSSKGVTLEQAARGTLRSQLPPDVGDYSAAQLVTFQTAAECGFSDMVQQGLEWITGPFAQSASLGELVSAMAFLDRLRFGHIAGMPTESDTCPDELCQVFTLPKGTDTRHLLQAAIALLEGRSGSEEWDEVVGVLDLILWYQQQDDVHPIEAGRLLYVLRNLLNNGSGLMQGCAAGAVLLLDQPGEHERHSEDISPEDINAEDTNIENQGLTDFHHRSGSWMDAAVSIEGRKLLASRLRSALLMISPRLMAEFHSLNGIEERLLDYSDDRFLQALPAARKGFSKLPEHQKKILRQHVQDRHQSAVPMKVNGRRQGSVLNSEQQQAVLEADRAACEMLKRLLPDAVLTTDFTQIPVDDDVTTIVQMESGQRLSIADRWRLILGDNASEMSTAACRAARALDELYGYSGRSRDEAGSPLGGRGGQEKGFPNTRDWNDELSHLFPDDVREEVLGQSLLEGRSAALSVLDHDQVRPSIELLEQVLCLRGHLPDHQTEALRKLARRITEQLAKELATSMAPALTGLSTPRPTRRRTSKLDLKRTVLSNLHTARMTADGLRLAPETFYFQQPAKRSLDWHIIYVLDISGSMEPSVIYSALTAAIFAGLPAVSVSFLAFNTEVIDFTDSVDDPLQMLLEVKVGGGTSIAVGVQAARQKMTVPSRTIVLLITDFEEGASIPALLAEVQALTDSGARALGLAALSDDGKPRYHTGIAEQVAACGMPVAALSPSQLARWVGEQIR